MEEPGAGEELGSSAKGKQGELIVIGELLKRGYKVYLPMVDSGIDCLVDIGRGSYREVQIKYREDASLFVARKFAPRESFFLICYMSTRRGNDFWVIPSKVFFDKAKPSTTNGREYLQLSIGKEGSDSYEYFAQFHSNFGRLLSGASREVKRAVRQASKRIKGQHFKQSDYEHEILQILSESEKPLSSKEIVARIGMRLGDRFSDADLERSTATGMSRWIKTSRFAIYQGLKRRGLIQAKMKNQWVLTANGRELLAKLRQ